MPAQAADFRKIAHFAAPLTLALAVLAASKLPSKADGSHMLVIPANDGYGFEDCLSGMKACGRVIADAWCEAHGMTSSISFGRADDVTASIRDKPAAKIEPGAFIVNCKD